MTVKEIVKQWLIKNKRDGLYNCDVSWEGCSCTVDDLMPCNDYSIQNCKTGYKIPGCSDDCGLGCEFHIGKVKP